MAAFKNRNASQIDQTKRRDGRISVLGQLSKAAIDTRSAPEASILSLSKASS
jgi:hypothetical protein